MTDGVEDGPGPPEPPEPDVLSAVVGAPAEDAVELLEDEDVELGAGVFFLRSDIGLNGSRCEKVSSFEPCVGDESTSTAGSVSGFAGGVAITGVGALSAAGFSMTSG